MGCDNNKGLAWAGCDKGGALIVSIWLLLKLRGPIERLVCCKSVADIVVENPGRPLLLCGAVVHMMRLAVFHD